MKTVIASPGAPKAIGPYSQAIKVGTMLFASGQIPIDPDTNEFVSGPIKVQTERVIKNLEAVLNAGGMNLTHVVKTTVYLADMDDFAEMNEAYAIYFTGRTPARATVEVSRLPKGARIEMDVIAMLESQE